MSIRSVGRPAVRRVVEAAALAVVTAAFVAGAAFDGEPARDAPSSIHDDNERIGVLGDGGRVVGYVSAHDMNAPPVVVDGRVQPGAPLDVYDHDGVRVGVLGPSGFVADGSAHGGLDVATTVAR